MRTWDSPAVFCNKGDSAVVISSEIIWRAIVEQPVDFVEVNSNTVTKGYLSSFICLFINFQASTCIWRDRVRYFLF